jgi:hypothetical protein
MVRGRRPDSREAQDDCGGDDQTDVDPPRKCLILGEPYYTEALVTEVIRSDGLPQLGQWKRADEESH